MLLRLDTENFSRIFINAKIPLDKPDFPGPVFNLGCKMNGVCQTTGHLKYPGLKFKDASERVTDDVINSDSSLVSEKQSEIEDATQIIVCYRPYSSVLYKRSFGKSETNKHCRANLWNYRLVLEVNRKCGFHTEIAEARID